MKTDDAVQIRAAAREFEHRRAAETITDGGDARRVHEFIFLQHIKRGIHASAKQCAVSFIFARQRSSFARFFWAHALAVNIGAKGDVAELRELGGAKFFIIGQAEPLMYHEHAGAFAGNGIVIGEKTFECRVALFVFDCFRVNSGLRFHGAK